MNKKDLELMAQIRDLKREHAVFILAHYYQRPEIQDIADYVGDSYAMALAARDCSMPTILVAGVDFMAETAAILCPEKTILSPEPAATCPMANSVAVDKVLAYRQKNPQALIVSYVNTPAAVKAVSDVCCTSSNAARVISRLAPDQQVLFLPDQHLGSFVAEQLGREIEVYPSQCPIHDKLTAEMISELREQNPEAAVLVHPECRREVRELADYVGSTSGILAYAQKSDRPALIIATECGILHSIRNSCPDKKLILASGDLICPNMKSITLEKIRYAILERETVISVPEEIREQAVGALNKMIEWAS